MTYTIYRDLECSVYHLAYNCIRFGLPARISARRHPRILVYDLVNARDCAFALDQAVDRDSHRVLGDALDQAVELDYLRGLHRDRDFHRVLFCSLELLFDRVFELYRDPALDLNRRFRFRVLLRHLNHAHKIAGDLHRTHAQQADSANARERVAVTWAAGHLAGVAVRVLPVAERARFGEEYLQELWELAAAEAGRWAQVGCAVRQLVCAYRLRAELKAPHRRKATP